MNARRHASLLAAAAAPATVHLADFAWVAKHKTPRIEPPGGGCGAHPNPVEGGAVKSAYEGKIKEGAGPFLEDGEEVLAAFVARPRGWTQATAGSLHLGAQQQGGALAAAVDRERATDGTFRALGVAIVRAGRGSVCRRSP